MLRHTWIIYAPNLAACADFLMKERVQLPISGRRGESAAAAGVAGAGASSDEGEVATEGVGASVEVQGQVL